MPKNGVPGGGWPPDKSKNIAFIDNGADEESTGTTAPTPPDAFENMTLAERAQSAREALRPTTTGERDRARKVRGQKSGTSRGVRATSPSILQTSDFAPEPPRVVIRQAPISFQSTVPKEKIRNASDSPYAFPEFFSFPPDQANSVANAAPVEHGVPASTKEVLVLDDVTREYDSLKLSGNIPNGADGVPVSAVEYIQSRFRGEIGRPAEKIVEPLPEDATHGEVVARLKSLKEKLTGLDKVEGERKLSAVELYDLRVDGFAQKHGLGDALNSVRTTKQAYFEARKLALKRGYADDNIGDLKEAYDRSLFGWKTTLETMSGGFTSVAVAKKELSRARARGDAKDNIERLEHAYERSLLDWRNSTTLDEANAAEALVIAKRDTILGPNNLELEARRDALTEKGKTALGRAEIWMERTPKTLLGLMGGASLWMGKRIAHSFNKDSFEIPNSSKKISSERLRELQSLTPEERKKKSESAEAEYAKKYARAVGVFAGAGIATIVALAASPVAATGALLTYTVYAGRGAVGILAGMGAAKATGNIFNKFFGNKRAEKLDTWLQKTPTTLEEYQEQQEAYKRNNSRIRANERSAWQMLAAMLTGSGVGLVSSPLTHEILHQLGSLESVQDAAKVVAEGNANSAGAGVDAHHIQELAKTAAEATQPSAPVAHIEPYSVSIEHGEGMDKLFVELQNHYKALYPDLDASTVPQGIRHILEAKSGNELSREFGFINEGNSSYVMHSGDSLGFDTNGNLVFTPHEGSAQSVELLHAGTGTPHHLTVAEQQGHFIRHGEVSVASTPAETHAAAAAPESGSTDAFLNRLQTAQPSEPIGYEYVTPAQGVSPDSVDFHHLSSPSSEDLKSADHTARIEAPHQTTSAAEMSHSAQAPAESASQAAPAESIPTAAFVNHNGVPVNPLVAGAYRVEGNHLVVWGGKDFQAQIDYANAFIAEQRKLGNVANIFIERVRENPLTGQVQTRMYEYSTETEDLAVYSPDSLPLKPYGPEDFVTK